jgi:protein-tyrosine-phosphatase
LPQKVLFVCTGNTCRSPMAEGLLRKMAQEKGWGLSAFSAGLAAFPGVPAAPEAVEAAKEKGFDLEPHQSQPLSKPLVLESDLIVTMTARHKEMILKKMPGLEGKVQMLSELAGAGETDIEDPVGQPIESYRETLGQIEDYLNKSAGRFAQA